MARHSNYTSDPMDRSNSARGRREEDRVDAAAELRAVPNGQVISPNDLGYDAARRIWNGAIDHHPALIVRCVSVADVQAALGSARKHNLSVSVRSGGYDWAGRSVRDGGIVIDLSAMRRVTVDPQARTAKLQGGSTAADTLAVAEAHGLAAVTGTIGNIGMAGFTLAGGYGPLSPHYGLGLDNLLAAEVVLADGRCVTTSDTQNPELFWALRGGGGNFGVVSAMTIRLHPVAQVLAGKILFPWSDATAVLTAFGEIAASAKDALAITVALVCSPDGSPAVVVAPCWSGDIAHGESVMAKVASLGSPLTTNIAPMPCSALFNLFEPSAPPGRRYAQQTRWLPGLTHAAAKTLVGIGDGTALPRTSPLSVVALQSFHGAPSRVPAGTTAFGVRNKHVLVSIVAAWEGKGDAPRDDAQHQRWAHAVSQALALYALPGGYPNLLGPDEHAQIAAAYGGNAERLCDAKWRFDPEGVFTATPLPCVA
jgi:FAD/FMN-containing dehydrogenase